MAKKNVISLKDEPSTVLNGIKYLRPKGTVYKWVPNSKRWYLLGDASSEDHWLDLEDVESNPDWYKETTKKATYTPILVDDYTVVFKKGKIEVGCRTIKNSEIREVVKHLID